MWACENKHFEIGRLLLKYHPQVHIQDKVCRKQNDVVSIVYVCTERVVSVGDGQ